MKMFFSLMVILVSGHFLMAQDNIYLDGDNYITLSNSTFAERTDWTGFSDRAANAVQQPVVTYWFTHNGRSHIVIHLKNDKSEIFIELSRNKSTYHFPQDINYTPSDNAGYHFNDFYLYVKDQTGVVRKFGFEKIAHIVINVQQLDPSHLKIDFQGNIGYYPHPSRWDDGALSSPMRFTGKISLSKKKASPEHLVSSYNGCDNAIYDEVSPNWRLGQWRTATECEEFFYKKVFDAMNTAMQPVYDYFKSQGWILLQRSVYKPLDVRLKGNNNGLFITHQFPYDNDYVLSFSANPMKGPYYDQQQKMMQFSETHEIMKDGHLDTRMFKQLLRLKEGVKDFSFKIMVCLNRKLETEQYSSEVANIPLDKQQGYSFVIKKVISNDLNASKDFDTYLLVGNWRAPEWQSREVIVNPLVPADAKELSIQSIYIDIDCGKNLAPTIINHIDLKPLHQLINNTP
jgi:hypothetical protein